MPQNALVGWRFSWPKWANPFQAVNKKYVDDAVAGAAATPHDDARLAALELRLKAVEDDLKKLREEAGFA
jgi:hypothetical protein